MPADVTEAELAAAAFDFGVANSIEHRDVSARVLDVEFPATIGDFDSAAAGVENSCPVTGLRGDIAAARLGMNVAVDLSKFRSPPLVSTLMFPVRPLAEMSPPLGVKIDVEIRRHF